MKAADICPDLDINSAIFLYRDNKGQTPYIVAPDKDTRNVFRKYMGENPDKYDYRKAQVEFTVKPFYMYSIKYKQNIYIQINFFQFNSSHLRNSRSLAL